MKAFSPKTIHCKNRAYNYLGVCFRINYNEVILDICTRLVDSVPSRASSDVCLLEAIIMVTY